MLLKQQDKWGAEEQLYRCTRGCKGLICSLICPTGPAISATWFPEPLRDQSSLTLCRSWHFVDMACSGARMPWILSFNARKRQMPAIVSFFSGSNYLTWTILFIERSAMWPVVYVYLCTGLSLATRTATRCFFWPSQCNHSHSRCSTQWAMSNCLPGQVCQK